MSLTMQSSSRNPNDVLRECKYISHMHACDTAHVTHCLVDTEEHSLTCSRKSASESYDLYTNGIPAS